MGAKYSSQLKKKWFPRKSGNIKKNSVAPVQVKPADDIDGPVSLLKTRTSRSSPIVLDAHTVKSKDLDLAAGEYNEDDRITSNEEHHKEHAEEHNGEHQEVHYEEIRYNNVTAEIKTHYFNSFSQEWFVFQRTQQVPIIEMKCIQG